MTGRLPVRNGFYSTNKQARNCKFCRYLQLFLLIIRLFLLIERYSDWGLALKSYSPSLACPPLSDAVKSSSRTSDRSGMRRLWESLALKCNDMASNSRRVFEKKNGLFQRCRYSYFLAILVQKRYPLDVFVTCISEHF